MPLAPGTRLGPYEVSALLGAGGMGEVYRARDTRLHRTVAIKVLAEHRISDPSIRQRFDREARAVAALSHPHICHLNDVGHQDGVDFLVMEYLEGETLAERLARQRLPIDEVLRYGTEIVEALAEAHRHGIVHRDLKPSNVILTKTGVKLLDFGLAKLQPVVSGPSKPGSTLAATRENPLTDEGSILGTWPYMAPEQLEGKEADARTDIFAFGAMLYEMATGTRAFEGDSHASLIAAILERDPAPLTDRRQAAPAALDRIVRKCLAKQPDARWQSARDLADALRWIVEDQTAGKSGSAPTTVHAQHWARWPWAAAIVAALGLGAAGAWRVLPRGDAPAAAVRRYTIQPPDNARIAGSEFALSHDGALVYEANGALYLRPADQLAARPLPGTEGGFIPTFSPDGQWIAFMTDSKIRKVSRSSGAAAVTLADFSRVIDQSIAWLPDNTIAIGQVETGLFRVSAEGGTLARVTTPDKARGEIDHHNPRPLPGGKAILATRHRGAEAFDVAVVDLGTGSMRVIVPDAFDARYVPTGHLVFARGESLLAAPFDVGRLELGGPPIVMLDHILTSVNNGAARYAVADDGTLAYMPSHSRVGRRLSWVGPDGTINPLPIGPLGFSRPTLSPDGTRVAVQIDEDVRRDIFVYDLASGTLSRLTTDGASESPIWTPDGKRVTFSTTKAGRREVYWQPVDGTVPAERLVTGEYSVFAGSWSPDGQTLFFTRQPPTDQNDIGLLNLRERRLVMTIASDRSEHHPRLSPDGRWLAYSTFQTGRTEVVVAAVDGGTRRQISAEGGNAPAWHPDGRTLYYRLGRTVFAVDVRGFPATIGRPTPVVKDLAQASGSGFGHPGYDVAADGRLLIVQPAEAEAAALRFEIVLNWHEELKQRVPVGR
jgi:eukaryotic-like serine/threonine-protein kinase